MKQLKSKKALIKLGYTINRFKTHYFKGYGSYYVFINIATGDVEFEDVPYNKKWMEIYKENENE